MIVRCEGPKPYRQPPPKRRSLEPDFGSFSESGFGDAHDIPINYEIRAPMVRLLGEDKQMLGVFSFENAMHMAQEQNVDLILQNDAQDPPLCRLVEWGKYKYEIDMRKKAARQKQRASRVEMKEIKIRPVTEIHDYQVKLRKAVEQIGRGNHVRLIVQFRGREIQNPVGGEKIAQRFTDDLGDRVIIESPANLDGRNLTVVFAPNKS